MFARKTSLLLILLLSVSALYAQQKFALVMGNGNYTGISRLNNPVNDANDMEAALRDLGFAVDKVLDGNLTDMENAVIRLKNRLSVSKDSYGFLFYAGHGVQSGGVNYLIPVGESIPSESFLRSRTVSVQAVMDELNDAGNALNIVVLDACRDNPFSWARSGSRGLTVLSNQPADSIIVYATSAGSTAADGAGRNGLFTGHLLNNLKTPGLEITEVFRRTMGDVATASNNQQRPAVYNQFPGLAYLGGQPTQSVSAPENITPQPSLIPMVVTPAPVSAPVASVTQERPGLYVDGAYQGNMDLLDAIDWIKINGRGGGDFVIVLGKNESAPYINLTGMQAKITLKSDGVERTVRYEGTRPSYSLFIIGSGVTFFLEDGVALVGLRENSQPLIRVVGGTFIMNGGSIRDNVVSSSEFGGGVYLQSGVFTMNGGTISGNSSSYHGGGVYLGLRTIFTMNGGTISGNTAGDRGGGVFAGNSSTFIKSGTGGIIYGSNAPEGQANKARYGATVYYNDKGWDRITTARASQAMDSRVSGAAGGWE